MGSMEELEARVSALEGQMRHVREDAAAARVLAGGADRDVSALASRLDSHTRLLQALRETQVEDHEAIGALQHRLSAFEGKFSDFEGKFSNFEGRFASLEGGFAGLARGQEIIIDLLRRRNGHSGESPTSAE